MTGIEAAIFGTLGRDAEAKTSKTSKTGRGRDMVAPDVTEQRQALRDGGFSPIPVPGKAPKAWEHAEPT